MRPDEEKDKFIEEDEFVSERGKYYVRPLKSNLELRRTLIYPITAPDGSVLETQWLVAKPTFEKLLQENRVVWRKKRDGAYQIYKKYYEKDGDGVVKPPSLIEKYPNNEAKVELKELFDITEGRDNVFYTVKPTGLLNYLFEPYDEPDAIIMDFFAGSSTTAHVVIEKNKIDCGKRKFILVQLPEPIENDDRFKTIADIGKERIRRVIKKITDEQSSSLNLANTSKQDLGFKVLKLDKSNFRQWQQLDPSTPPEKVEEELFKHIGHISDKATPEDLLYEILLKAGFTPTEKIETKTITSKNVFSIAGGALLLCLEAEVTKELINAVADLEPMQFICLDSAFQGNDQLKANAVQTFAARNMQKEKHNQIIFKTV